MAKYNFYRLNEYVCTLDEIQAARIQEEKEFIRCKYWKREEEAPCFSRESGKITA